MIEGSSFQLRSQRTAEVEHTAILYTLSVSSQQLGVCMCFNFRSKKWNKSL